MGVKKLINKEITWGYYHVFRCDVCYDMEQRGIESEADYWNNKKYAKSKIIYKLIKSKDRKPFYKQMKEWNDEP